MSLRKVEAAYDRWCPVSQPSRLGRWPVKAWRYAASSPQASTEGSRSPVGRGGRRQLHDDTHRPDATAEQKAALTAALDRGRELIASRHRPDGFNIGINVGEAGVPDPRAGVRHGIPAKGNYKAGE